MSADGRSAIPGVVNMFGKGFKEKHMRLDLTYPLVTSSKAATNCFEHIIY